MAKTNDALDDFVDASARLLELPIAPEWRAGVKEQLAIILRNANLVADFALPDEIDPAPTFTVTPPGAPR